MVKIEIGRPTKNRSGFTLLELLVVVGILAALVALALPFYQDYVNQSKITAAQADLQTFKKALAMFDQLEPKSYGFNSIEDKSFLPLVGRYLQDFRTSSLATNPIDPWGKDYQLNEETGAILSAGPDGKSESTGRTPVGDDLLVTWKPEFFIATARRVDSKTLELIFSRKIQDSTLLASNVTAKDTTSADITGASKVRISDTIFRINFTSNLADTGNVIVSGVTAQDGRTIASAKAAGKKPDGVEVDTASY